MKFVLLDRDGVINEDSPDYIKNWSEFHFIPGSLDALAVLHSHGYQVVIITNQSIIGRNMVDPSTLAETHRNLIQAVEADGGKIRDIFFCPHTPDDGCKCRKPAPGLILNAQKKFGFDLAETAMIGDSEKDMLAARNAGCGRAVLVSTGNGNKAREALDRKGKTPDHIAANLKGAVEWLVAQDGDTPGAGDSHA